MKKTILLMLGVTLLIACSSTVKTSSSNNKASSWTPLFNGKDLTGWTVRGNATWRVEEGAMVGDGDRGHIYVGPELTDVEIKGMFRIIDQGKGANSGLYIRATPPPDNPNGFPIGYEAQICHNQEAHTGWLWKPGKPTGKATALLTKDNEWFSMRVMAVGSHIQIWVNEQLVMTYDDDEFKKGQFAIQCHNAGMRVEAKEMYYRNLSQ